MKKFSIVMPFRDTAREWKFAEKSIPSAIALKPDELVIGLDAPACSSQVQLIRDICDAWSFKNIRLVIVERSNEWKFQLANVIWHCYMVCRNDTILAFDVDSVLRPAVLAGCNMVGMDNTAVVSFTKKLLINNPCDMIRYMSYAWRVRKSNGVFSGTYWIHRPSYVENVPLDGLQGISNGIDTYMVKCVTSRGTHKVVTLKDIGVDCLDRQNSDYPWRQFQSGIWYYANRTKFRGVLQESRDVPKSGVITKILDRYPVLAVIIKAISYQHVWLIRGYFWASRNHTHDAVRNASGVTFDEWSLTGATYVKQIRDWKAAGRLGTGFG